MYSLSSSQKKAGILTFLTELSVLGGDFEECQTIFYKIKKETLTVIVSA